MEALSSSSYWCSTSNPHFLQGKLLVKRNDASFHFCKRLVGGVGWHFCLRKPLVQLGHNSVISDTYTQRLKRAVFFFSPKRLELKLLPPSYEIYYAAGNISLHQTVHTDSTGCPASQPMGTGIDFPLQNLRVYEVDHLFPSSDVKNPWSYSSLSHVIIIYDLALILTQGKFYLLAWHLKGDDQTEHKWFNLLLFKAFCFEIYLTTSFMCICYRQIEVNYNKNFI